jgi:hypothetical protein
VGGQLCRVDFVKISRVHNNLAHELAQFSIRSKECQTFLFLVFRSGLYYPLVKTLLNS